METAWLKEGVNMREIYEKWETERLSELASKSADTLGRKTDEKKCDLRTDFQRDRDRIIHSKAFRRLMHKTQVFISPAGDHYRTRLTHTLEVSQIARTIARALRLNEDLTEAIALGHDLGHTPFGHAGESALNDVCPFKFAHNEQSVRLCEMIEKDGRGLNLTAEVLDGILNHRSANMPFTLEGKVVRLADKIAYLNHDIDDALRAKILTEDNLPKRVTGVFGKTVKSRLNVMITDTITESKNTSDILMSPKIYECFNELREFMFKNVYIDSAAKKEDKKISYIIERLYKYYCENISELPEEFLYLINEKKEPAERVVCDAVACMTDRYAITVFNEKYVPSYWNIY